MMIFKRTDFMSLPDLVLLEILSYLSCEDVLYAFDSLNLNRLNDLIVERGAFRQICLSPSLSMQQYKYLMNGVWSLHLVKSLVVRDVFAKFFVFILPLKSRLLPLLTDLRLIEMAVLHHSAEQFILAHSLTLTHLTMTLWRPSYRPSSIGESLTNILPHLPRLIQLDTGFRNDIHVSINYSSEVNYIVETTRHPIEFDQDKNFESSLTFFDNMSNLYLKDISIKIIQSDPYC
jgi:hypothetical protein